MTLTSTGRYSRSTLLSGIVSYWRLNELDGNRKDAVGTNHLAPSANVGLSGEVGKGGTYPATFVTASSQYLSIASNADLQVNGVSFTIAAWVYITSKAADRDFVGKFKTAGNLREYRLAYDATNDFIYFQVSPDGALTWPPGPHAAWGSPYTAYSVELGSPAINTWYHVLGYHDYTNGQIGIQVNNGAANVLSYASDVFAGGATFDIGASNKTNYHSGRVQHVALWKRLLYDTEKAELYNAGAGQNYPF